MLYSKLLSELGQLIRIFQRKHTRYVAGLSIALLGLFGLYQNATIPDNGLPRGTALYTVSTRFDSAGRRLDTIAAVNGARLDTVHTFEHPSTAFKMIQANPEFAAKFGFRLSADGKTMEVAGDARSLNSFIDQFNSTADPASLYNVKFNDASGYVDHISQARSWSNSGTLFYSTDSSYRYHDVLAHFWGYSGVSSGAANASRINAGIALGITQDPILSQNIHLREWAHDLMKQQSVGWDATFGFINVPGGTERTQYEFHANLRYVVGDVPQGVLDFGSIYASPLEAQALANLTNGGRFVSFQSLNQMEIQSTINSRSQLYSGLNNGGGSLLPAPDFYRPNSSWVVSDWGDFYPSPNNFDYPSTMGPSFEPHVPPKFGFSSVTILTGLAGGVGAGGSLESYLEQRDLAPASQQFGMDMQALRLFGGQTLLTTGGTMYGFTLAKDVLMFKNLAISNPVGALFGSALLAYQYYDDPAAFGDNVDGLVALGGRFQNWFNGGQFTSERLGSSTDILGAAVGSLGAAAHSYQDWAGSPVYDEATKASPLFGLIAEFRTECSLITDYLQRDSLTVDNLKQLDNALLNARANIDKIQNIAYDHPEYVPASFDINDHRNYVNDAKTGRTEFDANGRRINGTARDRQFIRTPYQVAKNLPVRAPAQIGGGLGGVTPGVDASGFGNTVISSLLANVNTTGLMGGGAIPFTPPSIPLVPDGALPTGVVTLIDLPNLQSFSQGVTGSILDVSIGGF